MKRNKGKFTGYRPEDFDCRYCLYYGGKRRKEILCLADDCVCKQELKETIRRERRKNGSKN